MDVVRKASPTLVLLAVLCVVALAGATFSRFQDAAQPGAPVGPQDAAAVRSSAAGTPHAGTGLTRRRPSSGTAFGRPRPLRAEGLTVNGISLRTTRAELVARGVLRPPPPPPPYTVVCTGSSHAGGSQDTLRLSDNVWLTLDLTRIAEVCGTSLELDGQVIARKGERLDRIVKVFAGWEIRRCCYRHIPSEIEFSRADLRVSHDRQGLITSFSLGESLFTSTCGLISD